MLQSELPGLIGRLDSVLSPLVPRGSAIAYLDYPVHQNLGDLLIYLGTEEWVRRNDLRLLGRWNWRNFTFGPLPEECLIVCHGGGNFGDLYETHQAFRERVIATYPGHRIVVLPQTVHFQDGAGLRRARDTWSAHRHCHLVTRDPKSLAIARDDLGVPASLAPDMACYLYPLANRLGLRRSEGGEHDLFLMRTDEERGTDQTVQARPGDWVGDWSDLLGGRAFPLANLQRANLHLSRVAGAQVFARLWRAAAVFSVRSAARELVRSRRIVTSRLHGYIIARLLDLEATLIDNSYGKNSRYFEEWHAG